MAQKRTLSDLELAQLIARTEFIISQLEDSDAEFHKHLYVAAMKSLMDYQSKRAAQGADDSPENP